MENEEIVLGHFFRSKSICQIYKYKWSFSINFRWRHMDVCSDIIDEGEKGKLALNHFCRQAILQRRYGTRKKITLATSICGNTLLRRWM